MAEKWYYTSEGQQLGPVSYPELQQLVGAGRIQPADLVWTEGMHQWAPATTARGLFSAPPPAPAPGAPAPRYDSPAIHYPEGEAPAASAPEGPRRPPQRPRNPQRGMSGGAKAALIGGIATGLLILVGVIVLVVVMVNRGADENTPIVNGRGAYTLRLQERQRDSRTIQFRAGAPVRITVHSDHDSDVDLFVYDQRNNIIAVDQAPDEHCLVTFVAPRTENYRVEVVNLGPGSNRCVVRCE